MHNYGHIENESALVTSQFHMGDSPKAITDFSHSERLETNIKLNEQKKKSSDSESIIDLGNLQLNHHLLPSITLVCHSVGVFPQILNECKLYHYKCIQKESNQLIFLYTTIDPLCTKICKNICCQKQSIPSQSNNAIVCVNYKNQKINIDALSGNYKMNEDLVLSIAGIVRRYNQTNRDVEVVDDLNHSNPYGITAISTLNVFNTLKDLPQFRLKIDQILYSLDSLSKPSKQQLQQHIQESTQLTLELIQLFKQRVKRHYHPYYLLAVEKAVFDEIYPKIFHYYTELNSKKESQFQQQRIKIAEKYNSEQMMDFLEVKPKYRLIQEYKLGIQEFNRIDECSNPREKLKCIQQMLCQVKSVVYEYSNEELVTMDDELPVMIYIMLMSEFENKYAQIHLIEDFCNTDPTIEIEKRILTTLRVSLDYIATEWEI